MLTQLALALSCISFLSSTVSSRVLGPLLVQPNDAWSHEPTKVPVVLGVMSGCPDAILCESVFDRVIERVSDKIDLRLTFIGEQDPSEPDFGVVCKHGRQECAGNVQELCAMEHAPFQRWWNFVHCQNFQGRYEVGKPETALKCANTAGLDWETSGVGACAGLNGDGTGEEGVRLLRESVRATEQMGIKKSCTVMINEKQVCVRDGEWKDCEGGHAPADFIRQIELEYDKLNAV